MWTLIVLVTVLDQFGVAVADQRVLTAEFSTQQSCEVAAGWLRKMLSDRPELSEAAAEKIVKSGQTLGEFRNLAPHKQAAKLAEIGEPWDRRIIVHAECLNWRP